MTHSAFRSLMALTLSAAALILALGASNARADDFVVNVRIPVNFDHLSPKVVGLELECFMYDAKGKSLQPLIKDQRTSQVDIDPNVRHYNGVLTYTFTFDQDQAMKIDWGSYLCNAFFDAEGGGGDATVGNPRESHRLLPGAVVQTKGSLF